MIGSFFDVVVVDDENKDIGFCEFKVFIFRMYKKENLVYGNILNVLVKFFCYSVELFEIYFVLFYL